MLNTYNGEVHISVHSAAGMEIAIYMQINLVNKTAALYQ